MSQKQSPPGASPHSSLLQSVTGISCRNPGQLLSLCFLSRTRSSSLDVSQSAPFLFANPNIWQLDSFYPPSTNSCTVVFRSDYMRILTSSVLTWRHHYAFRYYTGSIKQRLIFPAFPQAGGQSRLGSVSAVDVIQWGRGVDHQGRMLPESPGGGPCAAVAGHATGRSSSHGGAVQGRCSQVSNPIYRCRQCGALFGRRGGCSGLKCLQTAAVTLLYPWSPSKWFTVPTSRQWQKSTNSKYRELSYRKNFATSTLVLITQIMQLTSDLYLC